MPEARVTEKVDLTPENVKWLRLKRVHYQDQTGRQGNSPALCQAGQVKLQQHLSFRMCQGAHL